MWKILFTFLFICPMVLWPQQKQTPPDKQREVNMAVLLKKQKELLEAEAYDYKMSVDYWKKCSYIHNGTRILDITSEAWTHLASSQQDYAKKYQEGYAKRIGKPVEKIVTAKGVAIKLRLIPPGRFMMGIDSQEVTHRVIISKAYWMGKYEVTQGQWQKIKGDNPASFQNAGLTAPVENVSWTQCEEFCSSIGMRLPTEAEWEYACMAGGTYKYCFGSSEALLGNYAWYNGNAEGKTHRVGEKLPNPFGLYDMHGNVFEWCRDVLYGYTHEDAVDPCHININSPTDNRRMDRGGCWSTDALKCRSTNRHWVQLSNSWYIDNSASNWRGFRCVLDD